MLLCDGRTLGDVSGFKASDDKLLKWSLDRRPRRLNKGSFLDQKLPSEANSVVFRVAAVEMEPALSLGANGRQEEVEGREDREKTTRATQATSNRDWMMAMRFWKAASSATRFRREARAMSSRWH